jgi:D-xylose transport system ATP-binding protein
MTNTHTQTQPLLDLRGINKRFGAVQALQDVDFRIYPSELVGLVGDNGAGKSTLIKIISGVLHPDSGNILFEGQEVSIKSPDEAKSLGIETLYQDLALINNLDVVANMFLGREQFTSLLFGAIKVLKNREMERRTSDILEGLQVSLGSVREKVEVLSGGQRQAVAIGRAVGWGKKLVLLDEPTAALGVREAQQALELIRRLKDQGVAVVAISHNLEHIFSLVDRVVVLRQGIIRGERQLTDVEDKQTVGDEIVAMITGVAELKRSNGGNGHDSQKGA